jgi:hypothetical protein
VFAPADEKFVFGRGWCEGSVELENVWFLRARDQRGLFVLRFDLERVVLAISDKVLDD